jgi:ABC-2 type transport system permease protein
VSAPIEQVVAARVPERSWRSELRAAHAVWWREMIRFADDRVRMVTASIQPLLFLFVLAPGLRSLSAPSTDGVDLTTFMFPGVLCMTMWFSAMMSAASLVMDRELGFLHEMTVAPVRRSAIVAGKCMGGMSVATIQGLMLLAMAGVVHVPYDPMLLLGLLGLQLLIAFAVTAFGMMLATTITRPQAFNSVMQVVLFPLIFLSGAMFPVAGLPSWLAVLNRLDPLTYAVDPMRRLVFSHLDISDEAQNTLAPGVAWWGWRVPTLLEIVIVLVVGVSALGVAVFRFTRTE